MRHIKTQTNQNLVTKDYQKCKRILGIKGKGFFFFEHIHLLCSDFVALAKAWVEVVSLLCWMLQRAAQVITQASRHVVKTMLDYSSCMWHTQRHRNILKSKQPSQTSTKEQRRGHSPGCLAVTRNPTSQLSGTPGPFPGELPMRKVPQPVVGCHVATVRGRAEVTQPPAVLKHSFRSVPSVASRGTKSNMLTTLLLLFLASSGRATEKGEWFLSQECHGDMGK